MSDESSLEGVSPSDKVDVFTFAPTDLAAAPKDVAKNLDALKALDWKPLVELGGGVDMPCLPLCFNKQCGSDGCGGSCGSCANGGACVAGRCRPAFDLVSEYSDVRNPSGPWTYGFASVPGGALTPFDTNDVCDVQGWRDATLVDRCAPSIWVHRGHLKLRTGLRPENRVAVIRFTAPAGGWVRLSMTFESEGAGRVAAAVHVDGRRLQFFRASGRIVNQILHLGNGSIVDFSVDPTVDGFVADLAELAVKVHYLPSAPNCRELGCEASGGTCQEAIFGPYCACRWTDPIAGAVCVCEPQCKDRECGMDGCGGTCGTCGGQSLCEEVSGRCTACGTCYPGTHCGDIQGLPNLCAAGDCGAVDAEGLCEGDVAVWCQKGRLFSFDCGLEKRKCDQDPLTGFHQCLPCAPKCKGAACGEDGCGGLCGLCQDGQACFEGVCVSDEPGALSHEEYEEIDL